MEVISIQIVGFVISIILSGFFSASETALNALNKLTIKKLIRRGGVRAKLLGLWIENPKQVLSAILVGNRRQMPLELCWLSSEVPFIQVTGFLGARVRLFTIMA